MKRTFIIFIMVVISVCVFSQCSKTDVYEIQKPIVSLVPDKALEKGTFNLLTNASMITVRVLKNGHIPVKGSLYFSFGSLEMMKRTHANLAIDITSWDSGLSKRDAMIMKDIFKIEDANKKNVTAKFTVTSLSEEGLKLLREKKAAKDVSVTGLLECFGKKHDVKTFVSMSFNEKNRLVIKTTKPMLLKLSDLGVSEALPEYMEMRQIESIDDQIEVQAILEFVSPVS